MRKGHRPPTVCVASSAPEMKSPAPPDAALLVIDVQCGLFCSDPAPDDAAGTIQRINDVIHRTRRAGRPVIFIQHAEAPDLIPDSAGWQLHPALARTAADTVIGKTACDAFCGTVLDEHLRRLGISTLLLTGFATEFCVDTTLRNAASRGYRILVVSDAHTTKDRPVLSAAQIKAHHNWIWSELSMPQPITLVPAADLVFG